MIVISVSKRWYHPRSEVRQHGKNGAKKRWFVFYFDEEADSAQSLENIEVQKGMLICTPKDSSIHITK